MFKHLYDFARPWLFKMEPEKAHHFTLSQLDKAHRFGLLSCVVPNLPKVPVNVMGLQFNNPIGLAAGMDKNGQHIDTFLGLGFGFVEVGTVTPLAQAGNPSPRLFRLEAERALINRLGFNNEGLDQFLVNVKRAGRTGKNGIGIVGLNIGKNAITPLDQAHLDYEKCLRGVYPHADYVTVNISSPNTSNLRDLQEGDLRKLLFQTLKDTRDQLAQQHQKRVPILIKIAPDLSESAIAPLVDEVIEFGFEGIVATNTTLSREAVQHHPLHTQVGGLSGAPLFEKSTEILAKVKQHAGGQLVLIGVGGITEPQQILTKIQAGADLVQIYSGLIYAGPKLIWDGVKLLDQQRV